eukprot:767658_1
MHQWMPNPSLFSGSDRTRQSSLVLRMRMQHNTSYLQMILAPLSTWKCASSKDHPEYYQTAVLEHGAIQMHADCAKTVEENLLKIKKQQIEFEIAPDLSDA